MRNLIRISKARLPRTTNLENSRPEKGTLLVKIDEEKLKEPAYKNKKHQAGEVEVVEVNADLRKSNRSNIKK
ncbi:hypothetical protein [Cyclobacterium salsum]|uniref:hypothetical protein n=1 Tax=Cyclobacterium salsum TaxID=2666329 RepID=UPI0013918E03|nr:hypothetical protein [Cyclobacterium salsum]